MRTIANIIWLIFGGLFSAIGYFIGGLVLCLTVVGIPFGLQCFKLADFMLWPFGRTVVGKESGNGCLLLFLNIVWLVFVGIGLAIGHIVFGILLCLTIIGIPFGKQHFKMVEISLMPFGREVVDK
jgi:uncharacterized membrane protein YccF (DUF307 family)